MSIWRAVVAVIAVTAIALPAKATILSGRVGLSTYMWEKAEPDSTSTRHVQNSGNVNLRMARIGGHDLTVSTSLRGRFDVRNAGDNVDDYRVQSLQFRWRNIAKVADLTGGRQRIYWPTGTVGIDGGQAAIRFMRRLELSGYFGLTVPDNYHFSTTEYDDGHAFGARLQYRPKNCNVALSFAQLNRARSYMDVEVDNMVYQRLALDYRRTIPKFGSAYGNVSFDMLTERIHRAHVSVRWRAANNLSVNGQFRYRQPNIPYNSIFWVFGGSRYYEGRLRLNYRIDDTWSLNVGGAQLDLVDDKATRFDLGVTHRFFNVMVHGKTGYAGNTMGLSGGVLYPVNDRWLIRGGTHFSSFELIEDQTEANFQVSTYAGVQWMWMAQSSLDLEAQMLSQDIKTETDEFLNGDSDFRILARVSYWFFNRFGG